MGVSTLSCLFPDLTSLKKHAANSLIPELGSVRQGVNLEKRSGDGHGLNWVRDS
jgi:hypothetical protein